MGTGPGMSEEKSRPTAVDTAAWLPDLFLYPRRASPALEDLEGTKSGQDGMGKLGLWPPGRDWETFGQ